MRSFVSLFMIVFTVMLTSCGGGGGGEEHKSSTPTSVVLNFQEQEGPVHGSSIGQDVYIEIQVSGSDMNTIVEGVDVSAGTSSVELELQVPTGTDRLFEAYMYDSDGNVLYYGSDSVILDGAPITITLEMEKVSDTTPPGFDGITFVIVISPTEIELAWPAAEDDMTSSSGIVYEIYRVSEIGTEDFTSVEGVASYIVSGLEPGRYCFEVHARDEAGNFDENTVQMCETICDDGISPVQTNCGVGECASTGEEACVNGQLVDSCTPGSPRAEICDGVDNDCNSVVPADEVNVDGDGYRICDGDCNDTDPLVNPGMTEILCDGIDQDCDGQDAVDASCIDSDGDGFTADVDCNDSDSNTFPGATEVCDGLDNDCDSVVPTDEVNSDGDGFRICDGDCDDTDPLVNPGMTDILCDGIDQNCNGTVDDGYVADSSCGIGFCGSPNNTPSTCASGVEEACRPGTPAPSDTTCDSVDDDCDGTNDENFTGSATTCGVGSCAGNTGGIECQNGQEVDTCDPFTGAVPEICDGLDNDCDSVVPADEVDGDGDGFRICDGDCDDSDGTVNPLMVEIPCDGIDQDCDGTDMVGPSCDTTPPVFGGLTSVMKNSDTEYTLTWGAATDNMTPSSDIVYQIFTSTIPGGQNLSTFDYTTSPGATSYLIAGLDPDISYYFVVRAQDENGNVDSNRVEMSLSEAAVTSLAAGDYHSIVLKGDGSVWAWGANWSGQLGDTTTEGRSTPVRVSGLSKVTVIDIKAGQWHTAALIDDGTVRTWGENWAGQLGDGTNDESSRPVQVMTALTGPALTGVTAIAAGNSHTVALRGDDSVWAWGANWEGQLGDGSTINRIAPVQVTQDPGLTGITAIAAGYGHTVVLTNGGEVWAWGRNSDGQLGDGTTTRRLTPVQVPGLSGVMAIAAGYGHTVALTNGGEVWAWGGNWSGQLGDGTTTRRLTPVQVPGLSGVTAISVGSVHTLALQFDGTVWAWGGNWSGQLGNGVTSDSRIPVKVNWYQSWARSYGGTAFDVANSIQLTPDGGYIAAGAATLGQGLGDAWILKLNPDGTVAWQNTYGGLMTDGAYSIQPTTDGGYIAAGYTDSFGQWQNYDAWILKLDADGTVAWQNTYGETSGQTSFDYVYSIEPTPDGGYIAAGYTDSFGQGGTDAWVLKLDPDGTVAWQKTYGGTTNDYVYSIEPTPDGGYIAAGYTDSFGQGSSDAWILKLNSDGTVAWQNTYGGIGNDSASSIQPTPDGGYIAAGLTTSFGLGLDDAWLFKLNPDGTVAWQNTYGGIGNDSASSIQPMPDGGYIAAGSTSSFGQGLSDAWIFKLSSDGSVGCELDQDSTAVVTETTVSPLSTNVTGVNTSVAGVNTTVTGLDSSAIVDTQCETLYDRDSDWDGLIDRDEIAIYGTDPEDVDTDNDGFTDGDEVMVGTDPMDDQSFPVCDTFGCYVKQGIVHLEDRLVPEANQDCETALTMDPGNNDATFCIALTLPFLLVEDPAVVAIIEGFGQVAPTSSEFFEIVMDQRDVTPFFGYLSPVVIPTSTEIQNALENSVLPELDRMVSLVRDVQGEGYVFELTPALVRDPDMGNSVFLDDGEFYLIDAFLNLARAVQFIATAYYVDFDNTISDTDPLSLIKGPDGVSTIESDRFFTLKPDGAAKMDSALLALAEITDRVWDGYDFVRFNDPDSATDNGIQILPSDYDNDNDIDADDEAEMDRLFDEYWGITADFLINRLPVDLIIDINDTPGDLSDDVTVTVDLSKLFTDPLDRTDLPDLEYDLPRDAFLSGIANDAVSSRMPREDVDGDGDPVGDWDDEFVKCYEVPTTVLADDTLNGVLPDGLFSLPNAAPDGHLPVAGAFLFPYDSRYEEYGMTAAAGTDLFVSVSPVFRWDGLDQYMDSQIYQVDPDYGVQVDPDTWLPDLTPFANVPIFDIGDITYDGTDLWASGGRRDSNNNNQYEAGVYKLDSSGAIVEAFPAPPDTFPGAIAYDGSVLYVALELFNYGTTELFVLDPVTGDFGPFDFSNADLNEEGDYVRYGNLGNQVRMSAIGTLIPTVEGSFDYSETFCDTYFGADQLGAGFGDYQVYSDGIYDMTIDNFVYVEGALSPDSSVVMYANLGDPSIQGLLLGIKTTGSGYTNDSLNGTFNHAGYVNKDDSAQKSFIGSLTFDGAGNYTGEHWFSQSNAGSDLYNSFAGTFTVSADGRFTMTKDGDTVPDREGSISADGKTLILSQTNNVNRQRMEIAVKEPAVQNYSNASLKGTYHHAGYTSKVDNFGNEIRESLVGSITFDGKGEYQLRINVNSSDLWTFFYNANRSHSGSYSVNPDGTFTMTKEDAMKPNREGAISEDGNILIISLTNSQYRQRIEVVLKGLNSLYTTGLFDIKGLTFDGTHLWLTDDDRLIQLDTSGLIQQEYQLTESTDSGLAVTIDGLFGAGDFRVHQYPVVP